jgi:hypothetical protein
LLHEVLGIMAAEHANEARGMNDATRAAISRDDATFTADYRARLDALLADDEWHRWPEQKPTQDDDYVVRIEAVKGEPYYRVERWNASIYGDEATAYWDRKCVTHWRPLPDPPA